jgi:hypothetical protein
MTLKEYIITQHKSNLSGENLKKVMPILHEFIEFHHSNINYIDKYKISKQLNYTNNICTNLDENTVCVENPKLSSDVFIYSISVINNNLFIEATQNSFI